MPTNGLLIDYDYCTGCFSCEIACKQEHNLPVGKWGIKVLEFGPMEVRRDKYLITYIPYPTDLCDLCENRAKKGKIPSCVQHCQAKVMKYGAVEDLAEDMKKKPKMLLWVPK